MLLISLEAVLHPKLQDAWVARHGLNAHIEDAPSVSWAPPDAGTGLPAHEFLGEALLQLGRRADAVREFEAALKKMPERRRSLEGLARATDAPLRSSR